VRPPTRNFAEIISTTLRGLSTAGTRPARATPPRDPPISAVRPSPSRFFRIPDAVVQPAPSPSGFCVCGEECFEHLQAPPGARRGSPYRPQSAMSVRCKRSGALPFGWRRLERKRSVIASGAAGEAHHVPPIHSRHRRLGHRGRIPVEPSRHSRSKIPRTAQLTPTATTHPLPTAGGKWISRISVKTSLPSFIPRNEPRSVHIERIASPVLREFVS